jgi:prepilin signal peptidase PulO-like enzyme (type II secretory pathway)
MDGLGLIALGILVLLLIPIVAADLGRRRIPHLWTWALGIAGLAFDLIRDPSFAGFAYALGQAAMVLLVAVAAMAALARLGRAGHAGAGDARLLVAGSLWVGLEGTALVIVAAGLALGLATLIERARGRGRWSEARPFAPMLAGGLLLTTVLLELSR